MMISDLTVRQGPAADLLVVVETAFAFDGKAIPGFGHLQQLTAFLGVPGILGHSAAFLRVFAILSGFLHRLSWPNIANCGTNLA